MIEMIIFYILTLAASALYLIQKNDKRSNDKRSNDEDKPSDNLDKLITSEPTEVLDKKEFEHN